MFFFYFVYFFADFFFAGSIFRPFFFFTHTSRSKSPNRYANNKCLGPRPRRFCNRLDGIFVSRPSPASRRRRVASSSFSCEFFIELRCQEKKSVGPTVSHSLIFFFLNDSIFFFFFVLSLFAEHFHRARIYARRVYTLVWNHINAHIIQ